MPDRPMVWRFFWIEKFSTPPVNLWKVAALAGPMTTTASPSEETAPPLT